MRNRIREKIKELGILQKDLAEKLEMTTVGLNQIAGASMPKIETFVKIANALGVPVWSLLLTDEELEAIRSASSDKDGEASQFRCPKCGAQLKVVPSEDEEQN